MGCCGPSNNKKQQVVQNNDADNQLSPIDLLKIRLARGEITVEEYVETKAVLEE
ncbi:SHOCT domain-containing protein [Paenibacillus chondroitinus]|uniref:SHOCT domain-containing protein n=1 Tax=Paenibacillus chondroitinus TaxID=59842 RepID=A0ABU6DGK1_9BACL|nr:MULTISPECIES: SHOCT domain-containing protein [Paenibacillus]MCY9659490.1 SHOCT domain-containing protein [Paenibacillus anseongense]MEB4796885.1 SHOCT domain-containing protein [Paenibacillus chondroitinus]